MGSENIYETTVIVQGRKKKKTVGFVKMQVEKMERSEWIWGMF